MKKLITLALVFTIVCTSCSTNKRGYNYKKHYRKQNVKKKFVRLFDIDHCKKNNHAYKY